GPQPVSLLLTPPRALTEVALPLGVRQAGLGQHVLEVGGESRGHGLWDRTWCGRPFVVRQVFGPVLARIGFERDFQRVVGVARVRARQWSLAPQRSLCQRDTGLLPPHRVGPLDPPLTSSGR